MLRWLQVGAATAGVGVALTMGQGVAVADPDTSGGDSASSAAQPSGDAPAQTPEPTTPNPAAETPSEADSPPSGSPDQDGPTSTVAAQTNTGSTVGEKDDEPKPDPEPAGVTEPAAVENTDHAEKSEKSEKTGTSEKADDAAPQPVSTPETRAPASTASRGEVAPSSRSDEPTEPAVAPLALRSAAAAPALASNIAAAPVNPIAELVAAPARIVAAVLQAVLAPFVMSGPGAPAQPPVVWAVLAWVRKQFEDTFDNHTPTANYQQALNSQAPNGSVSGTVGASDAEGDGLVYTIARGPEVGALSLDSRTGAFTYTPTAALAAAGGTVTFAVNVSDTGLHVHGSTGLFGGGHDTDATLTVAVTSSTPVTDPDGPVVSAPDAAGVVTGSLGVSTPNGRPPTYTVEAGDAPDRGAVTVRPDGTYTYTPSDEARHAAAADGATAADGEDTFTVTATGSTGVRTRVAVTVSIDPRNEAPEVAPSITDVDLDTGVVTGSLGATDGDGDHLTYTGSATVPKGALVVNADGTYAFTPTDEARHAAAAAIAAQTPPPAETFVVTVDDGHGSVQTVTLSLDITPANADPVFDVGQSTVDPVTGAVSGRVTAVDADNDPLTYSGGAISTRGTLIVNADGTFTYTPTAAARHAAAATTATVADRVDSFTFTVIDGHGGTATQIVSFTISPTNTAPATPQFSIGAPNQDGVVTGVVSGFEGNPDGDAEGDPLSYSGSATSTKGTLTVNPTGTFTYTPTAAARAAVRAPGATAADKEDTFTITVSDGHGGTTTATVTFAISAVNGSFQNAEAWTNPADPTTGTITGGIAGAHRFPLVDPDGDTITYTVATTSSKGALVVNADGTFTYTPTGIARRAAAAANAPASDRTDVLAVTVSDGYGATQTVTISFAISALYNSAPTAAPAKYTTVDPNTGRITGYVTITDAQGDRFTVDSPIESSQGGRFSVAADGTFTYTPLASTRRAAAAYPDLTDTAFFTVTDSLGAGTQVAVSLYVSPAVQREPGAVATVNIVDPANATVGGTIRPAPGQTSPLSYAVPGGYAGSGGMYGVPLQTDRGYWFFTDRGNGAVDFAFVPSTAARDAAGSLTAAATDRVDSLAVIATDSTGGRTVLLLTAPMVPSFGSPAYGASNPNWIPKEVEYGTVVNLTDLLQASNGQFIATALIAGAVGSGAFQPAGTVGATTQQQAAAAVAAQSQLTRATVAEAQYLQYARNRGVSVDAGLVADLRAMQNSARAQLDAIYSTVSIGNGGTSAALGVLFTQPSLGAADATTGEIIGGLGAVDRAGQPLTYRLDQGPSKGDIALSGSGTFRYKPTPEARLNAINPGATAADKVDTLVFTVTDSVGLSYQVVVTVELSPVTASKGTFAVFLGNSGRVGTIVDGAPTAGTALPTLASLGALDLAAGKADLEAQLTLLNAKEQSANDQLDLLRSQQATASADLKAQMQSSVDDILSFLQELKTQQNEALRMITRA